ncbi:hypothetical protein [Deinococcus radiodurans]|uniref:hypothetical protein n=1 Tax=Deinococcus radiodurans TaxID=1299 RepID=UPI002D77129C|nr:hypothetical protein [Deinococcus radiodurans]
MFTGLLGAVSWASAQGPSVDERINAVVTPVSHFLSGLIFASIPSVRPRLPLIVVWLAVAAIVCTLSFRFVNIWGFKHGIDLVRGRYATTRRARHGHAFSAADHSRFRDGGSGKYRGVAVALTSVGPARRSG